MRVVFLTHKPSAYHTTILLYYATILLYYYTRVWGFRLKAEVCGHASDPMPAHGSLQHLSEHRSRKRLRGALPTFG